MATIQQTIKWLSSTKQIYQKFSNKLQHQILGFITGSLTDSLTITPNLRNYYNTALKEIMAWHNQLSMEEQLLFQISQIFLEVLVKKQYNTKKNVEIQQAIKDAIVSLYLIEKSSTNHCLPLSEILIQLGLEMDINQLIQRQKQLCQLLDYNLLKPSQYELFMLFASQLTINAQSLELGLYLLEIALFSDEKLDKYNKKCIIISILECCFLKTPQNLEQNQNKINQAAKLLRVTKEQVKECSQELSRIQFDVQQTDMYQLIVSKYGNKNYCKNKKFIEQNKILKETAIRSSISTNSDEQNKVLNCNSYF